MYLLFIQVLIIMVLIPMTIFYLLRSLGYLDSIMAEKLSQRRIPLAIQALLIFILTKYSVTIERAPELHFFFIGACGSTVSALAFLLMRIKISLHMMALSGLLVFLVGLSIHGHINMINTIAFFCVMTGLTASSRLYMKAHDWAELIVGFIAGVFPQIVLWYLWL
ncbi:MAG: hypothetical protein IR153_01815 [Flavobacterium sp.]|nr:hypothetical protein [Flavobacterium sp.]